MELSPAYAAPGDEVSDMVLRLAREQGDSYLNALKHLKRQIPVVEQRAGDYVIGYAVDPAEGFYQAHDGGLEWEEPRHENVHVQIMVRDADDGRFIPNLTVWVTLLDPHGNEIDAHVHPFIWHSWLWHYCCNWAIAEAGEYTMIVWIDKPTFRRHHKTNGNRFAQSVEVEFRSVKIETPRNQTPTT